MDAVWSLIFAFVCVVIGLFLERKKESRGDNSIKSQITPIRKPGMPFRAKPVIVRKNQPLPVEGQHIELPEPTADEMERKRLLDKRTLALRKHYTRWQQAVAAQTALNRNQFI